MKNNIQKELLDLLKQIIEIDTCYPPGSSKNFGKFVSSYLKNSGLQIRSYGVDTVSYTHLTLPTNREV